MNKDSYKVLHLALTTAALLSFIMLPFIDYYIKMSGFAFLKEARGNAIWPFLYITIPIICGLFSFCPVKERVVCALAMLIPIFSTFIQMSGGGYRGELPFGAGFYMYVIFTVALIVLNFSEINKEDSEHHASDNETDGKSELERYNDDVREYPLDKLSEIINNPSIYSEHLVNACRHEMEIRDNAEIKKEMVVEWDDEKINEILNNKNIYSEDVVYLAQKENKERLIRRAEEARIATEKKAEEVRLERERITKENAERRKKWWGKNWVWVVAVIFCLAALSIIIYLNSDRYNYNKGVDAQNNRQYSKAVKYLEKIESDSTFRSCDAHYRAHYCYLQLKDTANAVKHINAAVAYKLWRTHDDAYQLYVKYLDKGNLAPYLMANGAKAAEFKSLSSDENLLEDTGIYYFNKKNYNKAKHLFELSSSSKSFGYLGLMYRFGFEVEKDLEKAWQYLQKSPDCQPFVVHKGDFSLYLKSNSPISNIKAALKYYEQAIKDSPNDYACALRYEIVKNTVYVYENSNRITSKYHWGDYRFTGGEYVGQLDGGWYGSSADGWGMFVFDSGIIRLGYYKQARNAGLGINIYEDMDFIDIGNLQGNKGYITSGIRIYNNGSSVVGSFSDNKYIHGKNFEFGEEIKK